MSPHGKILIVEDEAPTLDALQRLLVNEGWTVETAAADRGAVREGRLIPFARRLFFLFRRGYLHVTNKHLVPRLNTEPHFFVRCRIVEIHA